MTELLASDVQVELDDFLGNELTYFEPSIFPAIPYAFSFSWWQW